MKTLTAGGRLKKPRAPADAGGKRPVRADTPRLGRRITAHGLDAIADRFETEGPACIPRLRREDPDLWLALCMEVRLRYPTGTRGYGRG